MNGLRPAGVTRACMVLVLMTGAFHVVSRTTGSGWLVVVVSGLVAVLVLSAVLPALALAGVRADVGAPRDAVAGRPVSLTVAMAGRPGGLKARVMRPASEWRRVDERGAGEVPAVPARRGVVAEVDVELRSAAPFGLVWWRRRLTLPLPTPMEVAPVPREAAAPRPGVEDAAGRSATAARRSPDLVRSVRDYMSGDPYRLVSWAATARHGRVLVKELEGGGDPRLTIVVDLRGDQAAGDEAASVAAGLAVAALREGIPVEMATAEAAGPRLGPVGSALDVGRRLARATGDGRPPEPSGGGQVLRVAAE